jgi:hypothetical protein
MILCHEPKASGVIHPSVNSSFVCDKFSFFTINNYLTGPSLHSVEDEPKHLFFIGVFRLFHASPTDNI